MKSLPGMLLGCVLAAGAGHARAENANISTCAQDACQRCCPSDCGPCVYSQVEALFFSRANGSDDQPVVIDGIGGGTLLSTGDLNFGYQPGVRALVGWQIDECRAWEVSYFGIYNWSASETEFGANDLAIPGDLGLASEDFFDADRIRLDYSAELHNAEVNYVVARDRFDLLLGFRYVSLDEEFNINSTDSDSGTSDYNIRASNDLYGGQLGARVRGCRCGWDWEATAKGGLFGNTAEQRQFVTDFPPPFLLRPTISDSTTTVAFVGDVNLSAVYQWTEAWAVRGGYNLLWIEGIALAPDQLDFTIPPGGGGDLQTGGSLFAHGFNIGLEAHW